MKKYIKLAAVFAALGVVAGVFYREYSKVMGVDGQFNLLGLVHPHFLVLGMFGFFVIGLLLTYMKVKGKLSKAGVICYTIGTAGAGVMLFIRGILDIMVRTSEDFTLSSGINGMISGISGLFHITLGTGLVFIFITLLKAAEPKQE